MTSGAAATGKGRGGFGGGISQCIRGRIGLADIAAIDRHAQLGRCAHFDRQTGIGEQTRGLQRHTCSSEPAKADQQGFNTVAALAVQRHNMMRARPEDRCNQTTQDATRPDFDKGPQSLRIHRLDHLDKAHRVRDLRGKLIAHRGNILRIRRTAAIPVHRNRRGGDWKFGKFGRKRIAA